MSLAIATFNVNGLRARLPLLLAWLEANRPDLLALQETKTPDADFPVEPLAAAGYQAAFLGQKAYNGVALLSREPLAEVRKGFPDGFLADQARLIRARLGRVEVVNSYVPQGQAVGSPAFAAKLAFFAKLGELLAAEHDPARPLVWLGDLNVAPGPLDVYDPQRLAGQVCFHPDEQAALARVTAWGLRDLFRLHHPGEKQFTFWDYRLPKALERNLGWRIDHLLATAPLAGACRACRVDMAPRAQAKPSDHTVLLAEFDLP